MDERGQFTFYASIYASASRIRNKTARADFYDAICNYALNGIEPDINRLSDAAAVGFISAKPNLDASRKKAKNGRAGGKAKQTESKPKANDKQNQANAKQTASEKEVEVEIEIEDEEEKEIENECYLSPPTPLSPAAEQAAQSVGAPNNDLLHSSYGDPKPKESAGTAFTAFWESYPKKIGREKAWNAWKQLNLSAQAAQKILLSLERWKKCGQWSEAGGRYIPQAENFLLDRYWETVPPSEDTAIPKGASGELGEAELEAIQRVLKGE